MLYDYLLPFSVSSLNFIIQQAVFALTHDLVKFYLRDLFQYTTSSHFLILHINRITLIIFRELLSIFIEVLLSLLPTLNSNLLMYLIHSAFQSF
jgi:hypothetical protein